MENSINNHLTEIGNQQHTEHLQVIHAKVMNPECRFCIAIPCYYGEGNIENTLQEYKKLIKKNSPIFEVIILLNGPTQEQIDRSDAKKQIDEFIKNNPEFPLQIYSITIPFQIRGKIGRLRGILVKINADRCTQSNISTNNFFHITHDADLLNIDSHYLSAVEQYFHRNPNTQIVGGHVEYPESFKSKYYLGFILQRIEDAFCKIRGYRNGTSVKSGNAIYRLDNLLLDPFRDAKKGEATFVVNATLKRFLECNVGKKSIVNNVNGHIIPPIISSPRRIVLSIEGNNANNFSRRHESFGQEGDYMFKYNRTIVPGIINDSIGYSNIVTKQQLELGIQGIYLGRITHINRLRQLSDVDKEENLQRMRKGFQKAAFLSCGIKLHFEGDTICIDDMTLLQEKILKKYGPLDYKQINI